MTTCTPRERLIAAIARLLRGCRQVAVGAASPLPAAGALLARELSGGALRVALLGAERGSPFTDGSRELFDCAAQGRIDAFFLSGIQIDGMGNVNLLGLGAYPALTRRFAGCFGAPFMATVVPRLILFREDHDPRCLVPRVDFVTAPGGRPCHLLTGMGQFRFARGRFVLERLHPGVRLDELRRRTGFAFEVARCCRTTAEPSARVLALLRGPVRTALADIYPRAAATLVAA